MANNNNTDRIKSLFSGSEPKKFLDFPKVNSFGKKTLDFLTSMFFGKLYVQNYSGATFFYTSYY